MYYKLLIFFVLFKISSINGVDLPVVDGRCTCYKSGFVGSHVSELERRWRGLTNHPAMYTYLPRTEAEDLFDYWNDYKVYYFAASNLYKSINNSVHTLNLQFPSYYYPSDFERLFEGLFASEQAKEEWKLFDLDYVHQRGLCQSRFKTSCYYGNYENAKKDIKEMSQSMRRVWLNNKREIASIFEQIHEKCKKTHINLCSLYEHGYLQFTKGNYYSAAHSIKKLINSSKDLNSKSYLTTETYLTMGTSASLAHEYALALETLSELIDKDPSHIDAYIERAIVYFEMGDFDAALKDYLATNMDAILLPAVEVDKWNFAKGFMLGAPKGAFQRSLDIPATIASSINGISQVIWAIHEHPIDAPQQMIQSAIDSFEHLKSLDARALSKETVPELHALFQKWDTLDSGAKGAALGELIGKYGIDVLTVAGTSKGIQYATQLRRTNALANLKYLGAISESVGGKGPFIRAVEEFVAERKSFFSNAKIQLDKQGKHIKGHRNCNMQNNPSILTYADPEFLLKKYAGKGKPYGKFQPGKVGYKEVVLCEEIIGECVNLETKTGEITRRVTIHYDKNGYAHLVPAPPEI